MPRLSDDQRALRVILRHARPLGRDASLPELDGYWLAERLCEAEPDPVVITFRGVDGARQLAAVAGIPRAGECFRQAGVSQATSADAVIAITIARFVAAIVWLRRRGVWVSAYRHGSEVRFVCGPQLSLVDGVPLGEEAA
jgi:hypothetical protein